MQFNIASERTRFTGDTLQNLRSTKTFVAELEPVSDIELNESLGRDARESILIHVSKPDAADIRIQDRIKSGDTTYQILRRENNPLKPQVEFGAMVLAAGKDK